MDCPSCKEPMIVLEMDEIEIDHCLECRGVWLDEGELELLLENTQKKDELIASFEVSAEKVEIPKKCPICFKKMLKVKVGKSQSLIIDKCKKAHGLWFDDGELERLMILGSESKDSPIVKLMKNMFGKNTKKEGEPK